MANQGSNENYFKMAHCKFIAATAPPGRQRTYISFATFFLKVHEGRLAVDDLVKTQDTAGVKRNCSSCKKSDTPFILGATGEPL